MTSHFRLSLFPLMAMKHATRNLVSNSESCSSAFLPTYAYNCSPVKSFLHYASTRGNRGSASSCLWEDSDSKLLFFVIWNLKNLFRSDTFHTHSACECQLLLRVILNYESSRQFRTLLHQISFVLYYLFICLFIYAYGDVMRQD